VGYRLEKIKEIYEGISALLLCLLRDVVCFLGLHSLEKNYWQRYSTEPRLICRHCNFTRELSTKEKKKHMEALLK